MTTAMMMIMSQVKNLFNTFDWLATNWLELQQHGHRMLVDVACGGYSHVGGRHVRSGLESTLADIRHIAFRFLGITVVSHKRFDQDKHL